MSSTWDQAQQQASETKEQLKEPQGRNVWIKRILIGGTILTVLTLGALAFGAVAIPTVLLGGGLLLLLSPLLIGGAVITSPIWVPIGGLLLAVPPILATLGVGFAGFVGFVYWVWSFVRSSKTHDAAKDIKEGIKDATYCMKHRVYDTCQSAAQAGQGVRDRAQEAVS